jgi:hypothetical protein
VFPIRVQPVFRCAYALKADGLRLLLAVGRVLLAIVVVFPACLFCQTASTGALTGRALDPSEALVPNATIQLTNEDSGEVRSGASDTTGNFHFLLLSPGKYELQASKALTFC